MVIQPQEFDSAKAYVWLKALETKVNTLLREVDVVKNDFMKKQSDLRGEVKAFNDDLLELKRLQQQSNQQMDLVIKELQKMAGREEVQVLQKYIDFWNPLHFVTQRDVERILEQKERAKQKT